jgi:FKBP-type peptidyl-prolyl cis-trans isomerase (trigger factor)
VIDFEGKMNNVPFEGGTGKGHHLSLAHKVLYLVLRRVWLEKR